MFHDETARKRFRAAYGELVGKGSAGPAQLSMVGLSDTADALLDACGFGRIALDDLCPSQQAGRALHASRIAIN